MLHACIPVMKALTHVPPDNAHLYCTYDSRRNQTPLGTLPKGPYAPKQLRGEETTALMPVAIWKKGMAMASTSCTLYCRLKMAIQGLPLRFCA